MIDDLGQAQVIDFGLAHVEGRSDLDPPEGLFSIRWCAPELLADGVSTRASDVYAFASIALEVCVVFFPSFAFFFGVLKHALTFICFFFLFAWHSSCSC
jgi:serine/threonine protein kinase